MINSYPLNPQFGQGVYRRKLRLCKKTDEKGQYIDGAMEDCMHGFTIKLYYADGVVTAIDGQKKRSPFTGCEGAKSALMALIGTDIHLPMKTLSRLLPAISNCTHWLDLALHCIKQAARDEHERCYHVEIADEQEQGTTASIYLNETMLLSWQVRNFEVLGPAALAGNTLQSGFSRWVNEAYADNSDQLEGAYILQKGNFVAAARRFDLKQLKAEPASNHAMMQGACYTYSSPQIEIAVRADNVERDFTDSEEQLLKFL